MEAETFCRPPGAGDTARPPELTREKKKKGGPSCPPALPLLTWVFFLFDFEGPTKLKKGPPVKGRALILKLCSTTPNGQTASETFQATVKESGRSVKDLVVAKGGIRKPPTPSVPETECSYQGLRAPHNARPGENAILTQKRDRECHVAVRGFPGPRVKAGRRTSTSKLVPPRRG